MSALRLLIVDDHQIVRQGLRAILRVLPEIELVGEADGGQAAVALAAQLRPDVILMDLVMPGMDGVAAIAAIKRASPGQRIVVLTTFADSELVLAAVQAGADGYLLKDIDMGELERAIRTVHSGQPYLHPEATRHLIQATARPEQPIDRLTSREQEVLALVGHGRTNRQIAEQLTISEKTVSVHISNSLGKLGMTSRTQAALYAARIGLVSPDAGAAGHPRPAGAPRDLRG